MNKIKINCYYDDSTSLENLLCEYIIEEFNNTHDE